MPKLDDMVPKMISLSKKASQIAENYIFSYGKDFLSYIERLGFTLRLHEGS